ncbi:hypothetical protein GYMLUDRAFT_47046 [Collybiopsis luxurians FD-317 M1]|uniref:Uncharacterized protein n=1 Tax=Collybiopsis luxurians FD-317 M1 TaxID=944289 RepID=A0A0D0C2N0_9AGAR|nr:hypothetical protein GYMLUDRAFT_47046 [Collybiopsis luxurians FD-317 M1]
MFETAVDDADVASMPLLQSDKEDEDDNEDEDDENVHGEDEDEQAVSMFDELNGISSYGRAELFEGSRLAWTRDAMVRRGGRGENGGEDDDKGEGEGADARKGQKREGEN